MSTKTIIPWDIGATKCAVAVVNLNDTTQAFECDRQYTIKLKDCVSFLDLVKHIEDGLNIKMKEADAIVIGAAGQFDGYEIRLQAGFPYTMNITEVAEQERWPRFAVVHDYTPIVCATFTPYMDKLSNIKMLRRGVKHRYGRHVALGVGTGLGVKDGILLPNDDFWLGTNEMGHIGISYPPMAEYFYRQRHRELLRYLRREIKQQTEQINYETILSGNGITRLHNFVYQHKKCETAEEVGEMCQSGRADETIKIFSWYLGLFIGTIELTFMPRGGIWISGGVVLKNMNIFDHPDFYHGIQASPAYQRQRSDFPLGVLCNPDHAFWGGAYYAAKRLLV